MADSHARISGDDVADCSVIKVHVASLSQLFDSLDPSPFHIRDLDRKASTYIVESARDIPRDRKIGLLLYVDEPARPADDGRIVGDAVRDHYAREADYTGRRLRRMIKQGWVSLAIGLSFLVAAVTASTFVTNLVAGTPGVVLRETLIIGGWVSMWRPLEIFLYDWWPVHGERRLYERMSRMAVQIEYTGKVSERSQPKWSESR